MNLGARSPGNGADNIPSEFLIVNDEDLDSAQAGQVGSCRWINCRRVFLRGAGDIRRGFDEGQLDGERRAASCPVTRRANSTAMQFHE